MILCAARWYLRYSLLFRDVEELLSERGLDADHTTIWRWVQRYGPELEGRLRRHLKPTNGIVKLTLRPAQCRDEHSPAPLPSASLSARNHQPCRLALPQILHELPGC